MLAKWRIDLPSSDVKETLLLLSFSFFMREYLTYATIGFIVFGAILLLLKVKLSKNVRNGVALLVFGSYWWSYGKVIDPEVGLNFLTTVIVIKLMEKETLRDRFMIFFGLILVISAGSLFEKTLGYMIFFGVSFFVLIQDFYRSIGARWRVGELLKALLWVVPLTSFLFFLAPRAMSPLPFQQGQPNPGEIGYTSNVYISQVESLNGNNTPVFDVQVSRPLQRDLLYWRGNSISFTDGWNWLAMNKSYPDAIENVSELTVGPDQVLQTFRVSTKEDYFFSLDHPLRIKVKDRIFDMEKTGSFPQGRGAWSPRFQVVSGTSGTLNNYEETQLYTRVPLKPTLKKWIHSTFPGTTPEEIVQQVKAYFSREKFSYSLAPGRIDSFQEFMQNRKVGFCSHYASALAIVLRVKKIPARLVSGFMGGAYNPYADFYQISQNDAHVWVEVLQNNQWRRVDPTAWMDPSRISLGGEAYMTNQTGVKAFNFLNQFGWYYDLRMWMGQWDFVFYQWLEDMDYQFQEKWISKFKLKRHWVYSFAILSLVFFMSLYAWSLKRQNAREKKSFQQELWKLFLAKVEARGLHLQAVSLEETKSSLQQLQHKDRQKLMNIWERLVKLSFEDSLTHEDKEIHRELRKL